MENELRLGNLFILRGKIVEFDDKLMHSVIYGGLEGSKPIPLTEEWLLKFGFRRLDKYTFARNGIFIHMRKRGIVYSKKLILENLHELQNLYFALTKQELTMK